MKPRYAFVLLLASILLPSGLRAEKRTFIDQSGRPLEGELVSVAGDNVTIKRTSDGQTFTMKAANFSRADQAYFVSKGGTAPAAPAPTAPAPSVGSTSIRPVTVNSAEVSAIRPRTSSDSIV